MAPAAAPAAPAVAFDVTPLASFRTGIGTAVDGLWTALAATRPERLLPYALGARTRTGAAGLPAGTRGVRLPTRALLAAWSRTDRPRLDRWLRGADVVHATNFITGPSRLPTLVTVHDIGFVLEPAWADPVVARFAPVLRRAVARGAHLHVPTRQVAAEVDEAFGPGLLAAGRISVIPFGVPSHAAPGPLPAQLREFLAGGRYVLAIGRQDRRKNLARLVAAFDSVAAVDPELRLVLAGPPGSETPEVDARLAALAPPVRRRVRATGPVSAAVGQALLEQATVLAYPSLYEGFGFPPLQAMAAGVPVLAGTAGAVVEVAGPAAELVDPTDVDAIAAGLHRLVADEPRRRELVSAGHRQVAGFSWSRAAHSLWALYDRLASSRYSAA